MALQSLHQCTSHTVPNFFTYGNTEKNGEGFWIYWTSSFISKDIREINNQNQWIEKKPKNPASWLREHWKWSATFVLHKQQKWMNQAQILKILLQMEREAVMKGMCSGLANQMQVREFFLISGSCRSSRDKQIPKEFLASFKKSSTEMMGDVYIARSKFLLLLSLILVLVYVLRNI